jgi:hypothetical protein
MTTENLAMLAVGQIIAAGMFSLGVLVGSSLRKESKDDISDEGTKEDKGWHDPVGTSTKSGIERRGGSSANQKRAARIAERAAFGRGPFWE